jgi:tetratricopeptide (TPR) repeat protein
MSTAETFIAQGYKARSDGRLEDAKQHFSESVALCRDTGSQTTLARSLTGLGQIERDLKNKAAALQHYAEAAAIYRSLPDPLRLAHTIRHVGDILRGSGAIEQARPHYEEALAIYREHGETSVLDFANAIRGFALLREDAGETMQARLLWQEAKGLYEAAKVQPGVQESDSHLVRLV